MSIVTSIALLNYNGIPVRIVRIEGQPWFIAADIFKCLGVLNTTTAVKSLRHDEARLTEVLSSRPVQALSENGLRKKLLRSTKPEARSMLDWALHEAIPECMSKHPDPDAVQRLVNRVAQLERALTALR